MPIYCKKIENQRSFELIVVLTDKNSSDKMDVNKDKKMSTLFINRWRVLLILIFSIYVITKTYNNHLNIQCKLLKEKQSKKKYKANDKMERRLLHVSNVCKSLEREPKLEFCEYQSKIPQFNQKIGDSFLQDPKTGTIYCYVHKVRTDII